MAVVHIEDFPLSHRGAAKLFADALRSTGFTGRIDIFPLFQQGIERVVLLEAHGN